MNNKAVQQQVQGRDSAGTVAETPSDSSQKIWQPRSDGRHAVLLNERHAAFDRRAPVFDTVDPMTRLDDPIWDDQQGKVWTPNLVHARLILTGEVIGRMPAPLQRSYRSVLGSIAQGLTPGGSGKAPPTPQEISLADWTLERIMERAHRGVLLASAFGYSGDKIAEQLQRLGQKIAGSTVQDLYLRERRVMAGQWQASRTPVDGLTYDRAGRLFKPGRK